MRRNVLMRRLGKALRPMPLLPVAFLFLASGILAAAGQKETAAQGSDEIVITSTWAVQHPGWELREDNMLDPLLLDKFGIKMEWVANIPHAEAREKLTVMFASDDYPDLLGDHNQLTLYNTLGMDGYLRNVLPLLTKVPNYRKMYSDFQWNMTFESRRASNNELYLMPQFRPWAVTAGIVYRRDEFQRLGLKEAATVDELIANLRAMKKAHPDSIPWGNKWGISQIALPLENAYQCTSGLYVDPFTDELVLYGGITAKMREIFKVLHTLYKEGLIDQEYATVTDTQFEDKIRQDKVYMVAAGFVGWLNKFNIINEPVNPDAEWVLAGITPSANGRLAYDPVVNGQPWGPAFTNRIEGERLDRYLQFLNWLCTEEGIVFDNYGIEGETYVVRDGIKTFVDTIDNSDPDKIKPAAMGIINWLNWSWDGILANYGCDAPLTYHENITNNSAYKPFRKSYPFLFETDMERDEYSNMYTIVNDTFNQYRDKFTMGVLDPNKDSDWNAYLDAMDKSGIKRFMDISVTRYKKDYQN